MVDDEYSIPKDVLVDAESRKAQRPYDCSECGADISDVMDEEFPICPRCGAPVVSTAAGDWLETELDADD
jgi:DNA-directed RNA polymerase subunit RPC12/RpoP